MAHIQSPFGWSKRYLAAQQRAEGDPVKQASDQARLALLRKKDADLDLAAKKIDRAEHRRRHEEADAAIADAAAKHEELAGEDADEAAEPARSEPEKREPERKGEGRPKPQARASGAPNANAKPADKQGKDELLMVD
jgi:hypothetical protein